MNQHVFQAYNPQSSQGFYDSFAIGPTHLQQTQRGIQQSRPNGLISNAPQQQLDSHHHQHPHHHHQQQQQQQVQKVPSPVLSLPPGSQSTSRQDSVEYDDDSDDDDEEEEEDTSEVMIPNDDIETRLKVAQEAQDAAASEGSNGVFACPYCDKRYNGKHARSIWRRHLQDKHAIPLSQQPRRTRWDGDANRPKNAEERRQRMLESKRRWARKKRQAEKVGGAGGAKLLSATTREDSFSGDLSPSENSSFSEPPKKVSQGSNTSKAKRLQKSKEPRPLKFHNITQGSMPPFADFGSSGNSGGGGMLWPTSGNGAFQTFNAPPPASSSHSNSNGPKTQTGGSTVHTVYTFHNSNSFVMAQQQQQQQAQRQQQQSTKAIMATSKSPRKALAQIDANSLIGRKLLRQSIDGNGQSDGFVMKTQLKVDSPQMSTMDMNRMTPLNRFNQAYPTPPSAGDSIHDKKMYSNMMPNCDGHLNGTHHGNMPLISPPASQHTNDSSPSYSNGNQLNMSALGMRNGVNSIYAPIHAQDSKLQRSPSTNPFSLDRHKISPSTSITRTVLPDTMQPPMSASRLTSMMESNEHRLSPIQRRRTSDEEGTVMGVISPKSRRLPPLVKTPLRALKMDENPTPSNFLNLSGMAGASTIRRLRSAGGSNHIDSWKGMMTPSEEMGDRMIGFTPLTIKTSRFSTSRGLASVSRPSRDNDQFSSPQHLNLTQSLGLAPHSTTKGGAYGISATPYLNHFMSTNSPWPDSVMRPMATAGAKRNRDDASPSGVDGKDSREQEDDEDDDEEGNNGVFVHETPSRPAKHHRSTLLGSAGRGSDDGSSSPRATRPGRLLSNSTTIKPLSFNLSNDRDEKLGEECTIKNEVKLENSEKSTTASSNSVSPAGSEEGSREVEALKNEM